MKRIRFILITLIALMNFACATIVGESTQLIPISSSPSEASIVITDERGSEIFKGQTPTTVTLQKSDGSYFGGKNFTVEISKPGYESKIIPVSAKVNGWYIGGNFIFGGLIGWLVVDPLSGAMYNLTPDQVNATLGDSVSQTNQDKKSIYVVLLEDVPMSLQQEMNRIY